MAQLEPKDIVLRAYSAANGADWARANRYLSPTARKAMREAARKAKASIDAIRLGIPGIPQEQRGRWSAVVRVFEDLLHPAGGWQADIAKGSIKSLRDVVVHYNNGGATKKEDRVNDFLSGGIRPLNLTEEEIDDLVAFMEALTSPEYEKTAQAAGKEPKR